MLTQRGVSVVSGYKDKIPAAQGKVEFLYDAATGGISVKISGNSGRRFVATYIVAVSMDGRHLLSEVPATGLGVMPVYPRPSVLTFIQSDEQGMWGRNCPHCEKYFRTNHVMGITCCPYCSKGESGLAFVSKEQREYIRASYDAFARARLEKKNTSLDIADITDKTPAWHYSEERQQTHFTCATKDCRAQTDILGEYGYCPRCSHTNAGKLFSENMDKMLARLEEVKNTVTDRRERGVVWEDMTVKTLSAFEHLAKHLRAKLLCFPMTAKRRRNLEGLNFQKPLEANDSLMQWFDIGMLIWPGNAMTPGRTVPQADVPFIKKMIQKRHILMHNGGIVDQDYLDLSGDTQARLSERIELRSNEAKRFIECVQMMGANLLDNVGSGFEVG
jgi:hypothetical protein